MYMVIKKIIIDNVKREMWGRRNFAWISV